MAKVVKVASIVLMNRKVGTLLYGQTQMDEKMLIGQTLGFQVIEYVGILGTWENVEGECVVEGESVVEGECVEGECMSGSECTHEHVCEMLIHLQADSH